MLDQFVMGNVSRLLDTIYPPFHFGVYLGMLYVIVKVVLLHGLLGYHPYGDLCLFGVVNNRVEVEIFHIYRPISVSCCVYIAVPVGVCGAEVHGGCCDTAWVVYQVSSCS